MYQNTAFHPWKRDSSFDMGYGNGKRKLSVGLCGSMNWVIPHYTTSCLMLILLPDFQSLALSLYLIQSLYCTFSIMIMMIVLIWLCRFGSPTNSENLDAVLERETIATTLTDHSVPYSSTRGTPHLPNATRYAGFSAPEYINPPSFAEATRSRKGSRSSRPHSGGSQSDWSASGHSKSVFVSHEDPFEKGALDFGPDSSYSVQTFSDGESEMTDATEYSHLAGAGQFPRTYHHLQVQTRQNATLVWSLSVCCCGQYNIIYNIILIDLLFNGKTVIVVHSRSSCIICTVMYLFLYFLLSFGVNIIIIHTCVNVLCYDIINPHCKCYATHHNSHTHIFH